MNAALVGRNAELRRLGAVLARADAGTGSVVMISGEAGIGKTRLCAELSRSCRARGGHVVLGRAVPEEASVPYAALADALRAARRGEPSVWEAAVARAEILWAIAPELAPRAGAAARSVDRPVLFEALLDAIEEGAGARTIVWTLDDIHWADDSTWEFVRYAARRVADLSVVLAVTYREEEIGPPHPWWPGLVRLNREPVTVRLPLTRLTPADSERLVRAIDPALPPDVVAEIVRRGAGTPLLVEELVSLGSTAGAVGAPGGQLPVPDTVRATVRELASRLGPRPRALLETVAVAGLELRGELLASLLPECEPADLVSAGLLEPEDDGFRFRHPLFQESVYAEIPAERKRVLHGEIAAALAKIDDYAAEHVAVHLERANRPESALSVLETAAAEASQCGQPGRNATLQLGALQLARRHRSLAGRRDDLERAAIASLFHAGRWTELCPLLRSAWAGRYRCSLAERAQLAAVSCKHLFWTGSIDQALTLAAAELADLEALGALDTVGPLLLEAALAAWYRGDGGSARTFADRALEVARRSGDVDSEIWATMVETCVAYGEHGNPRVAIACLDQSAAAARTRGLLAAEDSAWLVVSLLTSSSPGGGEARRASEQGDVRLGVAAMYEATFHLMEGDYQRSEAIFGRIRQGYQLRAPAMAAWVEAKEACLRLHRGDLDEARMLLTGPSAASEVASCGLIGAERSVARGWLAWEEDRFEEASAQLASACSDSVLGAYNAIAPGLAFLALRVDALLRLGRTDEAAAVISAAESLDLTRARFAAAALAAARFRQSPEPELARAAESAAAAAPWPWLGALVGCWRGEFLAETGAARAAREQFQAITAPLGVQRAEAVLRRLGDRAPLRVRDTGPLTSREIEVAELIAQGLTNPAIARQLFLSRPTVASHVAHILAKLGFSSRSQVAAWMAQRGTAPS